MKPPICIICHKYIENMENSGLIYFKKRHSDIEWDKRMKREGKVGHPPYARWFCEQHYSKAEELKDYPVDKAMDILNSEFK
jgi:hypothetical protein